MIFTNASSTKSIRNPQMNSVIICKVALKQFSFAMTPVETVIGKQVAPITEYSFRITLSSMSDKIKKGRVYTALSARS